MEKQKIQLNLISEEYEELVRLIAMGKMLSYWVEGALHHPNQTQNTPSQNWENRP